MRHATVALIERGRPRIADFFRRPQTHKNGDSFRSKRSYAFVGAINNRAPKLGGDFIDEAKTTQSTIIYGTIPGASIEH